WNQEEPNSLWIGHRDRPNETLIKDPSLLDANARAYAAYPGGHPEGYPDGPKNIFQKFYGYIRQGKRPGHDREDCCTVADGREEGLVGGAIVESHRASRWVEVAPE